MAKHEKQPKVCHVHPSFSAHLLCKLLKQFNNAVLIDSNEIHNTSRDKGKSGLLVMDSFTFHCFNLIFLQITEAYQNFLLIDLNEIYNINRD